VDGRKMPTDPEKLKMAKELEIKMTVKADPVKRV